MTPCYECKWVVTGNSTNKGFFREEGSTSIRRSRNEVRDEASLRKEFTQSAIDFIYEHEQTPWRPEPKYTGVTDLKVELGEIVLVGD